MSNRRRRSTSVEPVDDTVTDFLAEVGAAAAQAGSVLDAELIASRVLGMFMSALAEEPDVDPDDAAGPIVLRLAAEARSTRTPGALALMMAVDRVTPEPLDEIARAVVGELRATGVPEPGWARDAADWEFESASCYPETCGCEFALFLTFRAAAERHTLVLEVDHDETGGIADLAVADPEAAAKVEAALVADGLTRSPMGAEQAHELLLDLMDMEPAPEDDEAGAHLVSYGVLLAARLATLELAADAAEAASRPAAARIFRIKVGLAGASPPIWRRLDVPANLTLAQLHDVLQATFGWDDSHLHEFETKLGRIESGRTRRVRLEEVLSRHTKAHYTYDFGDSWRHVIELEDALEPEEGVAYPRCVGGRRSAPPEDSGGVPGYEWRVAALADPGHPDHDDAVDWLGPDFDPARFDLDGIDRALRPLARPVAVPPAVAPFRPRRAKQPAGVTPLF